MPNILKNWQTKVDKFYNSMRQCRKVLLYVLLVEAILVDVKYFIVSLISISLTADNVHYFMC